MGPNAATIAIQLGAGKLNELGFFQHGETEINGLVVRGVRLSYVGEPGWEITCKTYDAEKLAVAILEAGAKPAGVFAQSSMRIEKRFLAYGHDLDTDINPIQAGLDFAIEWNSDFIGKTTLLPLREQTPDTKIVSIVLDDVNAVPLGNEPVYADGEIIGKTTSAAFGYRIGKPVALALVNSTAVGRQNGVSVEIDIAQIRCHGMATNDSAY